MKLPGWFLLLLLFVFVLLPGGAVLTAAVVKTAKERAAVRRTLRAAAARYGLRPEFVDAIGWVESRWNPAAKNEVGPDGARGGAYGPTQITMRTAESLAAKLGVTPPTRAQLMAPDAATAAEWTGRILADHARRAPLTTLADYVAAWNAGRDDADRNNDGGLEELPATHVTRTDYLPKATAALAIVRAVPA